MKFFIPLSEIGTKIPKSFKIAVYIFLGIEFVLGGFVIATIGIIPAALTVFGLVFLVYIIFCIVSYIGDKMNTKTKSIALIFFTIASILLILSIPWLNAHHP